MRTPPPPRYYESPRRGWTTRAEARGQEPDMRKLSLVGLALCAIGLAAGYGYAADTPGDDVIARERAALDRWGKGDPQGFLDIYAPEITYFDPGVESRVDGHAAMTDYYRPFTGKIKIRSYEMISPKVQRHGD